MIEHYLDSDKIPYFVCVGTSRHVVDTVAPLIGDELKKLNISYIGDSKNNVNAKTIFDIEKNVISKIDTKVYQVIGLDAMIGITDRKLIFKMNPLRPGSAEQKTLPPIGTMQIGLNVLYDSKIRNWFYVEKGNFYDLKDLINQQYIDNLKDEFINEIKEHYINNIKDKKKRAIRVGDLALQGYSKEKIANIMNIPISAVYNDVNCYIKRRLRHIYKAICSK